MSTCPATESSETSCGYFCATGSHGTIRGSNTRSCALPAPWWRQIEVLLSQAYEGVGIEARRASELASCARSRYIDPTCGWELFPDTVAVLSEPKDGGWRHAILSNHVPELPDLVEALGLAKLTEVIMTSAITGYEKPHATAFALVLAEFGDLEQVWMVGDNPVADVAGAEAAGIPAIHVRTEHVGAPRHASDLRGAARIIRTGQSKRTGASMQRRSGEPPSRAALPYDASLGHGPQGRNEASPG